jgi:high-affinity Fe2+/Pb2+ permease
METTFNKAEELAENLKVYLDNRLDAIKFGTAEKTSNIIANILAGAIVALIFFFFVVFASISMAFVLVELTGKFWLGFLIVALFYFVLGLIIWLARVKIIRLPIMNSILQQLIINDDGED